MPRLFAGLKIPEPVSTRLARLRCGLDKVRWIAPADYHVTLRFFGDIDDDLAADICNMFAIIHKPPLTLTIAGLDVFGGTKPRAIFARITPSDDLTSLQKAIENAARQAGCTPETRKFTPHITLARVRGLSAETIAGWLEKNGDFTHTPFRIKGFALFSARPSRGGGPYVIERFFPFT